MSGHNKWSQIKHKKGATDAKKSKIFSKLARLISLESKKALGNTNIPGLKSVIEKARAYNMPTDNIERAIKKGTGGDVGELESITYEAYAPGGVALIIEALTGNRNKAASEIKFILSKHESALGGKGSALWAFTKTEEGWIPNVTVDGDEVLQAKIESIVDELEDNDEVQDVYTNLNDGEPS